MSPLETYRKQAKQLVRWHRAGNYSIAGRIRSLVRYRQLTDAQALKLKFPLATAQEIIARESGFQSWAELKAAVEADVEQRLPRGATTGVRIKPAASGTPTGVRIKPAASGTPTGAIVKTAIPVIFVASVAKAAEFFRDQLGFAIDFLHGRPAFYGGVSRDGVVLHLRLLHEPVLRAGLREQESLLAAFILVENVKALFEEYKSKAVPFVATLHTEPWGGPSFTVSDPDGNWILFSRA